MLRFGGDLTRKLDQDGKKSGACKGAVVTNVYHIQYYSTNVRKIIHRRVQIIEPLQFCDDFIDLGNFFGANEYTVYPLCSCIFLVATILPDQSLFLNMLPVHRIIVAGLSRSQTLTFLLRWEV